MIDTFKNDPIPWKTLNVVESNIEFRLLNSLDNSTDTILPNITDFLCCLLVALIVIFEDYIFFCDNKKQNPFISNIIICKINYVGTYLLSILVFECIMIDDDGRYLSNSKSINLESPSKYFKTQQLDLFITRFRQYSNFVSFQGFHRHYTF